MRFLLSTLFLVLPFSVFAGKSKVLVTGSSTIAPVMLEISKSFEKETGIRVDVQTGGSSRGIADQRKGLANIGMVSRALKSTEKDIQGYLLARDGIGLIVHADNPLQELSRQQVIDIYKGKIKNWKELGWKDQPINVVNKAEGRSTLEVFLSFFALKNSEIKASVVIGDNEQGIKTVSGNPYAIGYVSIGTAEFNSQIGVPVKALGLDGVAATVENVRNGKFPLARELNLIVKGNPEVDTQKLLDFALSKKTGKLIEQFYFVPLYK